MTHSSVACAICSDSLFVTEQHVLSCPCTCHSKNSIGHKIQNTDVISDARDTIPDGVDEAKLKMIIYMEDNVDQLLNSPNMFGSPDQQELLFRFCLKTLIWLKTGVESSWLTPPMQRFIAKIKGIDTLCICDQIPQRDFLPALESIYKDYKETY